MAKPTVSISNWTNAVVYTDSSGSRHAVSSGSFQFSLAPKSQGTITCNYANFHSDISTWSAYDWWGGCSETLSFNGLSNTYVLTSTEISNCTYAYYYQTIEYSKKPNGSDGPYWQIDNTTSFSSQADANASIAAYHPGAYDYKSDSADGIHWYIYHAPIEIVTHGPEYVRAATTVDVSAHITFSDDYLRGVNISSDNLTLTPNVTSTYLTAGPIPSGITGLSYSWSSAGGTGSTSIPSNSTGYQVLVTARANAPTGNDTYRCTITQRYNGKTISETSSITVSYVATTTTSGSIEFISSTNSSITVRIRLINVSSGRLTVTDSVSVTSVYDNTVTDSNSYTITGLTSGRTYWFSLFDGSGNELDEESITITSGGSSPEIDATQIAYNSSDERIEYSGYATGCTAVDATLYKGSISAANKIGSTITIPIASTSRTQFSRWIDHITEHDTYILRLIPRMNAVNGTAVDLTVTVEEASNELSITLSQAQTMSVNGVNDISNVVVLSYNILAPTLEAAIITIDSTPEGIVTIVNNYANHTSVDGKVRRYGTLTITPLLAGKVNIKVTSGTDVKTHVCKVGFEWYSSFVRDGQMTNNSSGNPVACKAAEWNTVVKSVNKIYGTTVPQVNTGDKITAGTTSSPYKLKAALGQTPPSTEDLITADFFVGIASRLNSIVNGLSDPQFSS